MARSWNGKSLIDYLGVRLWDTSETFRSYIIQWINEIQDDITSELPIDSYLFKLKKLIPVSQEVIDLAPEVPSKPTIAITNNLTSLLYNTTTSGNYTYNSTLIEFDSLVAKLKNNYDFSKAGSKYDTDINLDWTSSASGVPLSTSGSPTVSGGELDLTGGKSVVYDVLGAMNAAIGTIRVKYIPNYTGNPSNTQQIWYMADTIASANNRMYLYQDTASAWRMYIYTETGGVVASAIPFGTKSLTAGVEYEIEFNYDFVSGEQELFIDGVQQGSTRTYVSARSNDLTSVGEFRLGGTANADHSIGELVIWDTVKHTANYTPAALPLYDTTNPTIALTAGFSVGELQSFVSTVTTPTNTEVKFIIDVDGQDRYWNGSAWANSNGTFAESSTATEINDNANDLLSTSATIKVIAFLSTTDDQVTPEITSAVVGDVGLLTTGTQYKVSISNIIYNQDSTELMESESSELTDAVTADLSNQTITVSSIPLFGGDTDVSPSVIHRRVYISKKATGDSDFSEPFFKCDIEDNTTTEITISTEPDSTRTPVSDSELSQLSSYQLYFEKGNRYLIKDSINRLRRADPDGSDTSSPASFDYVGTHKIFLYPRFNPQATEAQRTLNYWCYRRPHEVFYSSDCKMDLPIEWRKALIQGVVWKAYAFRDRAGFDTQLNQYEEFKRVAKKKYKRQKGRPAFVRDVQGDTFSYEV